MAKQENKSLSGHVSGQSNDPLTKPAHALSYAAVVQETKANAEDGLTSSEATSRSENYGLNEFGEAGGVDPIKILVGQIANAMTLVAVPSPIFLYCVIDKYR